MDGSLSVLSIPAGMAAAAAVSLGKGSVTMEAAVPARESATNWRFAAVVKMVTAMPRRRRMRANWRRGMVWPLDMNGKRTTCC